MQKIANSHVTNHNETMWPQFLHGVGGSGYVKVGSGRKGLYVDVK